MVHCVDKLIEITLSIIVQTRIIQSYFVSVSSCSCNCICSIISRYWLQNCTSDSFSKKAKPRKLVSLCLGTLGQHLEDIITDISEFAALFPPHIKVSLCICLLFGCQFMHLCLLFGCQFMHHCLTAGIKCAYIIQGFWLLDKVHLLGCKPSSLPWWCSLAEKKSACSCSYF